MLSYKKFSCYHTESTKHTKDLTKKKGKYTFLYTSGKPGNIPYDLSRVIIKQSMALLPRQSPWSAMTPVPSLGLGTEGSNALGVDDGLPKCS